jgi:hypothetical protein
MELTDLKKTWDKLSSGKELDENQLKVMLGKRSGNLIERIERNIKIGFIILFGLILVVALDDFFISPMMIEEKNAIPGWIHFLNVFSYTLIFTTFIYFVIKYYRVKRSCDISCDLKDALRKIIETLNLYQRLFYLALISLAITQVLGFIAGLYQGSFAKLESQGVSFSEIQINQLLLEIGIGLAFIVFVVGGIFVFLRWGFRKLYGNYHLKLKRTLKELEEIKG